jgi:hypothetical protein
MSSQLGNGSIDVVSKSNEYGAVQARAFGKPSSRALKENEFSNVMEKKHRMGVRFLLNNGSGPKVPDFDLNYNSGIHDMSSDAGHPSHVGRAGDLVKPELPTVATIVHLVPIEPNIVTSHKPSTDVNPNAVLSLPAVDDRILEDITNSSHMFASRRKSTNLGFRSYPGFSREYRQKENVHSDFVHSSVNMSDSLKASESTLTFSKMRQSGSFRSRSAGVDTDPWAHENALAGVVIDDKRCFPCQQCGFIFGMRSNLKRHILTVHEDRRIFGCDLCSASFGLKQNLVTHVRVKHERRRPFSCIICGLTFGYKQVLQNHVRNIHDKRQFENDQAQ